MTDWIDWHGGELPVRLGTLVDVMYRNGDIAKNVPAGEVLLGETSAEDWFHDNSPADIIRYRILDAEPQGPR